MRSIGTWLSGHIGLLAIIVLMAGISPGRCEEGMWLPHDIPDEIMHQMQSMGLELSPDEIWNASGTGVANAVVSVGATGSFVSAQGLILTNHHVAFGAVQRISTPERNYIEDGFLAKTRADEVPAHGYIGYVLLSTQDVTDRVLSCLEPSMSPLERYEAIERATKEIVKQEEEGREVYCEVNSFFGGSTYLLDTCLKLRDIRVVYVPARSIGEYGGDIDNWMWPRHTGDFSFLRAYVGPDGRPADFSEDNVPYRPSTYLRIAKQGLSDGDFALIIGFPGRTQRYLPSCALAYRQDFTYPENIDLYRKTLRILDQRAEADPVAAVRVAGRVKGINNRLKNNEGMLEGFRKFGLVGLQEEKEREIRRGLEGNHDLTVQYDELLDRFRSVYDEQRRHAKKDLLLDSMLDGWSNLLGQAMRLYKWSLEKEKNDLDRDPDFMDREIPNHRMRLRVFQMGYDPGSDRDILRLYLVELADLPGAEGRDVLQAALGRLPEGGPGYAGWDQAVDGFLDDLYANTKLDQTEERLRMFDLSNQELVDQDDPVIALAARLCDLNEERIRRDKSFDGALTMLMPQWVKLVAAGSQGPIYSDANGTKRLNFGEVKGYSPRDGVYYRPFTTLKGVAEKNTGVPPFACPQRILDLVAKRGYDQYVDPEIGDVPVDFLTTHDSTGGNSGSPVLNARGELVGCLFDGNYEAMTADFLFRDDITRSISVDIRYVLFTARYVDGADNVLSELGVR